MQIAEIVKINLLILSRSGAVRIIWKYHFEIKIEIKIK